MIDDRRQTTETLDFAFLEQTSNISVVVIYDLRTPIIVFHNEHRKMYRYYTPPPLPFHGYPAVATGAQYPPLGPPPHYAPPPPFQYHATGPPPPHLMAAGQLGPTPPQAAPRAAASRQLPLPRLSPIQDLRNIFMMLSDTQFESECTIERLRRVILKRKQFRAAAENENNNNMAAAAASAMSQNNNLDNSNKKRAPLTDAASSEENHDASSSSSKKQKTTAQAAVQ
jgi:hypothetical protein